MPSAFSRIWPTNPWQIFPHVVERNKLTEPYRETSRSFVNNEWKCFLNFSIARSRILCILRIWLFSLTATCGCAMTVHRRVRAHLRFPAQRSSLHHMYSILNTPMQTHQHTCTLHYYYFPGNASFPTGDKTDSIKKKHTHTQISCVYLHQMAHPTFSPHTCWHSHLLTKGFHVVIEILALL